MRLIVGAGYDIRLRIRGWRRLVRIRNAPRARPGEPVAMMSASPFWAKPTRVTCSGGRPGCGPCSAGPSASAAGGGGERSGSSWSGPGSGNGCRGH